MLVIAPELRVPETDKLPEVSTVKSVFASLLFVLSLNNPPSAPKRVPYVDELLSFKLIQAVASLLSNNATTLVVPLLTLKAVPF